MENGTAKYADFHVEKDGTVRLFSLATGDEHGPHTIWDVDWSKTYGYVFHMSGNGRFEMIASGVYWAADGVQVKEVPSNYIDAEARERNPVKRIEVPTEFEGLDLLEWLENNAIQDDTVYCSVCDDHLPSESLCEHCWWCEDACDYSTPTERLTPCKDEYCRCTKQVGKL